LRDVSFFVLQHPDIALSGGAIDTNRLLERLLLLFELRCAGYCDNGYRQSRDHFGQMHSTGHVRAPPLRYDIVERQWLR
jgi:hypothetical protein